MLVKGVRAVLNVFVESKDLEKVAETLTKLPEITDVYEVTGEFDIVAMVDVDSITSFRHFLKTKILKIPGVRSTVTSVVMYTHKRDGKLVQE